MGHPHAKPVLSARAAKGPFFAREPGRGRIAAERLPYIFESGDVTDAVPLPRYALRPTYDSCGFISWVG